MAVKILKSGLLSCEEALSRLEHGTPYVPVHVGLDLARLTASIVSFEAGFDRGYLKKSRKVHLPLLAKIQAVREAAGKNPSPFGGKNFALLERKVTNFSNELAAALAQRDRVLTQNLKLWERVRVLELAERERGLSQARLRIL